MRAQLKHLFLLVSLGLILASGATATATASAAVVTTGTLTVDSARVTVGEPVSFQYSVSPAGPKNWVGLYRDPGNGPAHEEYVAPSLTYRYIPDASGSVSFPTTGFAPGNYVAYALENDGYAWLAQPVRFAVVDDEPLHFATSVVPLRNALAYTGYRAEIGGIVQGDRAGLAFRKVSGPEWLRVSAAGAVRGTPAASSAGLTAVATVEATNTAGESTRATITADVRGPNSELVPDVKVMTWNLWYGGTNVSDYREKQLRFLLNRDVDVIGVQESYGTSAKELGEALGWDYYQAGYDLGILSRYPIVKRSPLPSESGLSAISATVRLDALHGTDVTVWNSHLGYTPYGPYDACFGQLPIRQLLAKEERSGRTGQITDIVAAMDQDLHQSHTTPVLLTGDFNAASHLDWSPRTQRCGYTAGVQWPTSVIPTNAGLVDTYRSIHRDPVAEPGITWSPVYKTFTGGYGYDKFAGQPEPQDRIDFVYAKGDWLVTDSDTVVTGTPTPEPNHALNEWTSDHAAVITEFTVR